MESPICWLASYPKSGNTWVRFLLHQYFFGRAERSEEIAETIPDVHVTGRKPEGSPIAGWIAMKTHHRLSTKMPMADRTGCAIYIARHPRDVILSSLNYMKLIAPPEIARSIEPEGYVRNFIRLGGDPLFIQFGFGSILEHAGSWMSSPSLMRLVVRYEDLKRRPETELTRMLHFLGHEADPERTRRAVEDSSFKRLRDLEVAEKSDRRPGVVFAGAPARETGEKRLFMNAATSGASLDAIAPGLDALADERFAWILDRFGYPRTQDQPALAGTR